MDSMPVAICRFAHASFCRGFRGAARYGKDHADRQTFYGFRLHVRLTWAGFISDVFLAPANQSDRQTLICSQATHRSSSICDSTPEKKLAHGVGYLPEDERGWLYYPAWEFIARDMSALLPLVALGAWSLVGLGAIIRWSAGFEGY